MMKFFNFFLLDLKCILRPRNLVILILLFVALIYTFNKGVDDQQEIIKNSREFQEYEHLMFSKILNYTHYSFFGVRYLFVPANAAVFFSTNTLSPELTAKIDAISNVKIYANCRGRSLFKSINSRFNRFSGLLYLLGSLLSLFAGFDAMRCKEFFSSLFDPDQGIKALGYIILSRFLFIITILILCFMAAFLTAFIRGMGFIAADISGLSAYLGALLITFLVMLIIGVLLGKFRTKTAGIIAAFSIWLVLVILVPEAIHAIIEEKVDNIVSSYQVDLKKLEIVNEFENRGLKKEGKFTRERLEVFKKLAEEYWSTDYPKIYAEEERLRIEVEEIVKLNNRFSIWFPTTFLNLTEAEVSSLGLENALLFQGYAQEGQKNFSRFYIVRVFYNDPGILVSFIKGSENLFHARSRIPAYFLSGVFIQLFIILVLFSWGAFRFKNWLIPSASELKSKKPFTEHEKNIRLKSKQVNVIFTRRKDLSKHLYLQFTFSGPYAPDSRGKESDVPDNRLHVSMDGQPLESFPGSEGGIAKAQRFVYICNPAQLPGDITPMTYISFMCRRYGASSAEKKAITAALNHTTLTGEKHLLYKLEPDEQADVLLSTLHLVNGDIILVDSIGRDMPLKTLVKLVDQLETLAKNNATVIYLTHEKKVEVESAYPAQDVYECNGWAEEVKAHRFLLEKKV